MFLAVDIGNSQTVLGLFQNSTLKKQWRLTTPARLTSDELLFQLRGLFADSGHSINDVESVIVSSVVPHFSETLSRLFTQLGKRLFQVDATLPYSFTLHSVAAHELGADRLVNAEAAVRDYGAPVLILDSGTATTLCAISPDREFLGGAIMPGIEISIESLVRRTAKLPFVELAQPESPVGINTKTALQSGILYGYACMVDGMVERFMQDLEKRFQKRFGVSEMKTVATGGVSARFQGITKRITHFDPNLTLKGLCYLHETLRSR